MTRNPTKFTTAVELFFKNYSNFSGRSSRSAYWWWFLASSLLGILVAIIDMMIMGADPWMQSNYGPVESIVTLALLVPNIAINVRRLHDVGKSGWWILIVFTIIGIIPWFIWLVREGNDGANKFGEDIEAGVPPVGEEPIKAHIRSGSS